jgi:hypothetical protein
VLRDFDPARYPAERLRAHAEGFAPARFVDRLRTIVSRALERSEERV